MDIFSIRHDHYHHTVDGQAQAQLTAIRAQILALHTQGETIMAKLEDVLKDVNDEATLIGGVSTMIAGLRQQVADALAGSVLPSATQAQIDQIFAAAEVNKAALAAALANVPPVGVPSVV